MPRPHPATAAGRQTVSFVGPADMKQPARDAPGGRAHLGGRGSSHELRQHPPLRQHTPNGLKGNCAFSGAEAPEAPHVQPRQVSGAGGRRALWWAAGERLSRLPWPAASASGLDFSCVSYGMAGRSRTWAARHARTAARPQPTVPPCAVVATELYCCSFLPFVLYRRPCLVKTEIVRRYRQLDVKAMRMGVGEQQGEARQSSRQEQIDGPEWGEGAQAEQGRLQEVSSPKPRRALGHE